MTVYGDRLLPRFSELSLVEYPLNRLNSCTTQQEVVHERFQDELYYAAFGQERPTCAQPVFSYKSMSSPPLTSLQEYRRNEEQRRRYHTILQNLIPKKLAATKVVSLPGMSDDYYHTSLAMLGQAKHEVAVVLYGRVTALSLRDSQPEVLVTSSNLATCVHRLACTNDLAIGFQNGQIGLYDAERSSYSLLDEGADSEIDCVASKPQAFYLGTKMGKLFQVDRRARAAFQIVGSHRDRICGIALHPENTLIATGGNDNKIKLWDLRKNDTFFGAFRAFNAAVKALVWAPWQRDLLFAGGGTKDPVIRALSSTSMKVVSEDACFRSQVTALHALAATGDIVSCHGYSPLQNQAQANVSVRWKYRNGTLIPGRVLSGHTNRVLYSALNPITGMFVTGSPDNTVRTWEMFDQDKKESKLHSMPSIR